MQEIAQIRNEDKLLLLCTQPTISDVSKDSIKALLQLNISWEYLLNRIYRHKLMPLVYSRLHTIVPEMLPKEIQQKLQQDFGAMALRNLLATGTLLKLLQQFQAANIIAVPFKGPILASMAYGDVALRQFSDLDIVVRTADLATVHDILTASGFEPDFDFKKVLRSILIRFDKEYGFKNKKLGLSVDLHWQLDYLQKAPSFDANDNFEKVVPITINDFTTRGFSIEKQFVLLNSHVIMHRWEYLSQLCDLAFFLHKYPNIQWQMVLDKIKTIGITRGVGINFLLLNLLWNIPIPDAMQTVVSQTNTKFVKEIVTQNFFKPQVPLSFWKCVFFYNPLRRDNYWEVCKDFLGNFATPKVGCFKLLPLPRSLFFLYFIIRPVDVIYQKLIKRCGVLT